MSPGTPTAPATGKDHVATRTVTILRPQGLHARPALELVKAVLASGTDVTITGSDDTAVDASSLLAVMVGDFSCGADVLMSVTGPDADAVLDQVSAIVVGE